MTASAYLRHPAVPLAAVATAILLIWYALGFPAQVPRSPLAAGEKLPCLSYAPVPVPEMAANVQSVPLSRIEADLALLAPLTTCVRTYMTGGGLNRVPEIARGHGMTVLQGIALGRDAEFNRAEIERAQELARTERSAIRAFVAGSESLSKRQLGVRDIGEIVRRLREETRLPVTYADQWETWLHADTLAPLVDFVTIHVDLYEAGYPIPPADAGRRMLEARSAIASKFGSKAVLIGEIGWPSAGRMREAAQPSAITQALVLHDVLVAAKSSNIQINILEAFDQPWRGATEGTAGAHFGLIDADTRSIKFRWDAPLSNHPLWFMQAVIGVMLSLVVFSAGYVAARSYGTKGPAQAEWRPVALIALSGGLFVGWAVADIPAQSASPLDWLSAAVLIALAFTVSPVAAAAVVRKTPISGFAAVLTQRERRALPPLQRAVTILFVLLVIVSIQLALGLVFDPAVRDISFAPLTGPAAALAVLAFGSPTSEGPRSIAEAGAAIVLAASAAFIVFNEAFWNWQALWFAAVLLTVAAVCWHTAGAQTR
jgi:exo-beta-1,3-glucanase (GH17 family)